MSAAYPLAFVLLLPAVVMLLWFNRGLGHVAGHLPDQLPGHWDRLVVPSLRRFMSLRALTGSPIELLMMLALWVLLVAALARPGIMLESHGDFSNIAGRIIALDLGANADVHAQRGAVLELIESAPKVPTALVVATRDAFNAVPLTTDHNFIARYLNVIDADVMPIDGRSLSVATAHAEAVLVNAGIVAGQVVVLTAGEPPSGRIEASSRWARALVVAAQRTEAGANSQRGWQDYAQQMGARLTYYGALQAVNGDLRERIEQAARKGDREAHFDLTPILIAAALVLWLGLFRRQRTT